MAIIFTGTGERTAESFDGTQSAAPLLHVEYSGGTEVTPIRSWTELGITLDDMGVGVDRVNKRLFVSLGGGFETPQSYSAIVQYGLSDQGYALGFDNGPPVASGVTQEFAGIEYGSEVSVQLYQDGEFVDSYTLLFSNLPIVQLSADTIVDEPKSLGTFRLISGAFIEDTGVLNMGIEFRGATSQIYPKKSYSIELRKDDDLTDEKKITLLDMRKDGDWLMDATYRDTAFVRNIVSHDIYNDMVAVCHLSADWPGRYLDRAAR